MSELLINNHVTCHPFIIGELACGYLKNRSEIITLLHALPKSLLVDEEELLPFIEGHALMGLGLGIVDMHLLASALLTNITLWTNDKNLEKAAIKLNCSYELL